MTMGGWLEMFSGTCGGWLRNPVPVDRWFIPLSIGFQSSKVMQGFFHPVYRKTTGTTGAALYLILV
jgi:hypothetical protein